MKTATTDRVELLHSLRKFLNKHVQPEERQQVLISILGTCSEYLSDQEMKHCVLSKRNLRVWNIREA